MKKRTYRRFIILAVSAILLSIAIAAGYALIKYNKSYKSPAVGDSGLVSLNDIPQDSYFEIHFFDVGEGDSALIVCDGYTMLIDGGSASNSRFLFAYLKEHRIDHIDVMIASHAHEDHVGGLAGALNYATVGVAYSPVTEYDTRAFNSFVKYLESQGKEIVVPNHGDSFMLGNAIVQFVAPVDMELANVNENNSSIICRVVYGQTSFLFTGDAEEAEEVSLLGSGYVLSSTVLKVGHHGSYTSTTDAFLEAVSPSYCVISVGKDNAYGHPHDVVLERLTRAGCVIYRTDSNGEIICTSDGQSLIFSTER